MIKPMMRQALKVPKPTKLDDYGRPIPSDDALETKCNVRTNEETIVTSDGRVRDITTEIDIPPNVPIPKGVKLTYTDQNGLEKSGTVEEIGNAYNLSGSRIVWQTLKVSETP